MNRYEILIDATDIDALLAIDSLFANVEFTPAPESSIMTYATFDATDDALDAYLDRFELDHDERDDIFTLVD